MAASTYREVRCSDGEDAGGIRAAAAADVVDAIAGAWKTLRGDGGEDATGQRVLGECAEEEIEGEGAVKEERGWMMRKEEERGEAAGEGEDVNIGLANGGGVVRRRWRSEVVDQRPNLSSV